MGKEDDDRLAKAIAKEINAAKGCGSSGGGGYDPDAKKPSHWKNKKSAVWNEFASKQQCDKAKALTCRFRHEYEGRLYTLAEAGEGVIGGSKNGKGGVGAYVCDEEEDDDKGDQSHPLVKTVSDAKEILKGRLDMMKTARDKTGIDVNLHEHLETAVNSVQKRETGKKKYLWVHGLLPNGDPHVAKRRNWCCCAGQIHFGRVPRNASGRRRARRSLIT